MTNDHPSKRYFSIPFYCLATGLTIFQLLFSLGKSHYSYSIDTGKNGKVVSEVLLKEKPGVNYGLK